MFENINRPAFRFAARGITAWFLALVGAFEIVLGFTYGWLPLGALAAVAAPVIAGFLFRIRYTGFIADARHAAERKATDDRLAEQAAETRKVLASMPSVADMAAIASARLQARRDAVALGLACPDDCAGCAEDEREAERQTRDFLAERAARHGHTPPWTGDPIV